MQDFDTVFFLYLVPSILYGDPEKGEGEDDEEEGRKERWEGVCSLTETFLRVRIFSKSEGFLP